MKAVLMAAAAAVLNYPSDQQFAWREGAVYQVATRPGRITDIALQPGESLSTVNPVAAGDTVRWIVGDTESGAGAARQAHVLVKPVEAGLATSLLIATDRRTYHLELRSTAGPFVATVAWRYPEGELMALKGRSPVARVEAAGRASSEASPPSELVVDPASLNFDYRLEGAAPFRPERVYDDGRRTVIEFPTNISTGEMPPLFVVGADGKTAELVNYRVHGRRMVVDCLFEIAELRLGAEKHQVRVRIVREAKASR